MMIEIKHCETGSVLHRLDTPSLAGAALQNAHLHGADLAGANLTGAHLEGADLGEADLRGAIRIGPL